MLLGSLFAAGFGPNDLMENYSWEQIAFMGECIALHRMKMLEALLGPVASMLPTGATYKPGKVTRGRQKKRTSIDYTDKSAVERAKARDAALLVGLGQVPGGKIVL